MSSRWFLRRQRWWPTGDGLARRESLWAVSRIDPGASRPPNPLYVGCHLTIVVRCRQRSLLRSLRLDRSRTTLSKSSLRSESHFGRSKLQEHVYERHWTANFPNRWAPQSDRRRALHGRYSNSGRGPWRNRPEYDCERPDGLHRYRGGRTGPRSTGGVHASQHATHEPDAKALEPPASARAILSSFAGRQDSLRRPTDRSGCRHHT